MTAYHKKIGRWQGAGLLATTLLGTGVFILPQMTVTLANKWALVSWLLLTLAIIPVTLVFARLAAIYPHAGGPAYFVELAFGKVAGRSIGLIFLLIVPLGVPAAILITLQFADAFISFVGYEILFAEILVVFMLFLLNYKGIQVSAKIQFLLTLLIVGLVVILCMTSGLDISTVYEDPTKSKFSANSIMAAAGIAFWSFLGVEAMTHLASEFKNPEKDMIPAMLIGTCLVGFIYIACTALILITPVDTSLAMVGVFNQLIGGHGEIVIGIIGIAGGLSSANVYTASTTRLIWSFSNDGILPRYLSTRNLHNVPFNALITLLFIMTIMLIITFFAGKNLEHLIAWCNGVFVIIYFATMMAATKLLDKSNRFSIFLGCLFCVGLAWGLGSQMLYALIVLSCSIPFLWWQNHYHHSKRVTAEVTY